MIDANTIEKRYKSIKQQLMKVQNIKILALLMLASSTTLSAESGAVDFLRSTGKIYSVIAVIVVVLIGKKFPRLLRKFQLDLGKKNLQIIILQLDYVLSVILLIPLFINWKNYLQFSPFQNQIYRTLKIQPLCPNNGI